MRPLAFVLTAAALSGCGDDEPQFISCFDDDAQKETGEEIERCLR